MIDDANHQWIDRYSIPHAALGMVFEASRIPAWLAIGSHVGFELVEDKVKEVIEPIWPDTRPDSWENHVGDVASFTAGFYTSQALRATEAGRMFLTGFVALAGGVWMWNLINRHSWLTTSE